MKKRAHCEGWETHHQCGNPRRARRFPTSHVDVKTTFCHLDRSGEISFAVEISRLHCVPLEMTKVSRNPVGDDAHIVPHSRENDSANPYGSPIKILENAVVKSKKTKVGYYHMQYEWTDADGYYYKARWHTKTPNAPLEQRDVWVIERGIKGIGYGKSQRNGFSEILVAPNMWVDREIWEDALDGRKYGNITKELEEILEHGHWKA